MAITVDFSKDPAWTHPNYPYGCLSYQFNNMSMWEWLENNIQRDSWTWDSPKQPNGRLAPGVWIGFIRAEDYAMFVLKWK